jgi:hypothetical protein
MVYNNKLTKTIFHNYNFILLQYIIFNNLEIINNQEKHTFRCYDMDTQ